MVDALYKKLEPTVDMKTGQIKDPPKNKQTGEPITDVFSLEKISREANKFCKEFIRDLKIETQKQNQPEQKQEQTQGIKR
jgi:predicted ATP-grasp superfamily ATP-dependent carboligase